MGKGNVLKLTVTPPPGFIYQAGMYILLNCCALIGSYRAFNFRVPGDLRFPDRVGHSLFVRLVACEFWYASGIQFSSAQKLAIFGTHRGFTFGALGGLQFLGRFGLSLFVRLVACALWIASGIQ